MYITIHEHHNECMHTHVEDLANSELELIQVKKGKCSGPFNFSLCYKDVILHILVPSGDVSRPAPTSPPPNRVSLLPY